MATKIEVILTEQEREELEHVRDHHPKGYMRERAAALLKMADGQSATQVAYTGLLRKRYPHAVCEWVRRYNMDGLAGLQIREGRGRKAAFSPSYTR